MIRSDSTLTFPSMTAAAAASGIPYAALKSLKDGGTPGFEQSGRVQLHVVLAAVFAQTEGGSIAPPPGLRNWREALNKAQAERTELKLARERAAVVERAWVASKIQEAASNVNRIRLKSEAEDPVKFAATNGDTAECRTIIRGIWDGILAELQSLSTQFDEEARP